MKCGPLAALALLAIAVGCAPRTSGIAVAQVTIDPVSGYVSRIDVALPKDGRVATAPPSTYDYVVVTDGRSATYWRAALHTEAGRSQASLVLTPAKPDASPPVGATIAIAAVDRRDGTRTELGAAVVANRQPGILNPSFVHLVDGSPPVPAGWRFDASATGAVARPNPGSDASGIRLLLGTRQSAGWNRTALYQDVVASIARSFDVVVRPERDCDGNLAAPNETSGVSVSDGSGQIALYCLSSRVKKRSLNQFADGRETVVILPGTLRRWNHVRIRLADLEPYFRLYPDPDGMLRVTLAVMSHGDGIRRIDDAVSFRDVRTGS